MPFIVQGVSEAKVTDTEEPSDDEFSLFPHETACNLYKALLDETVHKLYLKEIRVNDFKHRQKKKCASLSSISLGKRQADSELIIDLGYKKQQHVNYFNRAAFPNEVTMSTDADGFEQFSQ